MASVKLERSYCQLEQIVRSFQVEFLEQFIQILSLIRKVVPMSTRFEVSVYVELGTIQVIYKMNEQRLCTLIFHRMDTRDKQSSIIY